MRRCLSQQGRWKQCGLTSVAWADVSLFLPRVVVVVRACLKILEKFSSAPPQAVLRGQDIVCPPAAIALIQMTPSAPQSYRLTLLSEPELYLKRKKQPTTENQTQQQQKPPNFPTGRVIIFLPCHFGSHSSSQPRAASFLLLPPRKLCHQLPPRSVGGQSPF